MHTSKLITRITLSTLLGGLIASSGCGEGGEVAMDAGRDDAGRNDAGQEDAGPVCSAVREPCSAYVSCAAALDPGGAATVAAQYGEGGSCWCGDEAAAMACATACASGLEEARATHPLETACHQTSCTLDELDRTQAYGPIELGSCPDAGGLPQQPFSDPFGLSGGYCAPPCSGLANVCPQHTQTSAEGVCYLVIGDTNYCASRCFVDPTLFPDQAQCPCGATCHPHGAPDGEGRQRGLCLFDP